MAYNFKTTLKKYWKDSLSSLGWNVLWSLFPLWAGYLFITFIYKQPQIVDFANDGEFAIYSSAMLASSFYIVLKEYKSSSFPLRRFYGSICMIGLIFSTLVFSAVTVSDIGNDININRELIIKISILIYVVSIIINFILMMLDNDRTYIDIRQEQKKQEKAFENEFDK